MYFSGKIKYLSSLSVIKYYLLFEKNTYHSVKCLAEQIVEYKINTNTCIKYT